MESLVQANSRLAKSVDLDGRLPVHWAASNNHLEVVRFFASQRSFDPDVQDESGWTPLMIASSLKDDAGTDIIKLLLGKEADPKIVSTTGATALHFAVSKQNIETIRLLSSAGASARVKDKRGQLPLHRAAAVGNLPIAKLLLGPQGKSPVNATDMDGMTALHHAISEGHGDVAVELMKAGAEINKQDRDGRTAMELAPDAKVKTYIINAAEREGIDL